jgi:hypothetical protein
MIVAISDQLLGATVQRQISQFVENQPGKQRRNAYRIRINCYTPLSAKIWRKKDNLSIPMAFFPRFLALGERKPSTNYEINTGLGIAVPQRVLRTE